MKNVAGMIERVRMFTFVPRDVHERQALRNSAGSDMGVSTTVTTIAARRPCYSYSPGTVTLPTVRVDARPIVWDGSQDFNLGLSVDH